VRLPPALRYREFRLFTIGYFPAETGEYIHFVVQNWLVWELTHSAFFLGLIGFFEFAPRFIFGPIGGVVADHHRPARPTWARATRPTVRTERPPVRRPPGSGLARGKEAPRSATGPRRGRRPRRATARRSALPSTMPRAAKHVRGRTPEIQPPGHIRVFGATLDSRDRDDIARKLGMRLGKFASSIERVTVRLSDVNGPKGGVDHKCLIKVALSGLPSVVVERRDSALQRAVNSAIGAAAQAVRQSVQRRRLRPLHRRRPRPVNPAS